MTAGFSFLLALAGCLPKSAVSRHDELSADAYAFDATVQVRTDGLPAGAAAASFSTSWAGELRVQWARTFRDGSIGRLVAFEDVRSVVTHDAASVAGADLLSGAWVELRAFDSGQVLSVEPIAPWSGLRGHLEVLDVLWPTLSPRLPSVARGGSAHDEVSFPTRVEGGPRVQTRMALEWTLTDVAKDVGTYAVRGSARATSPTVNSTSTLEGTVRADARNARLLSHETVWTRTVETRWPTGALVTQRQDVSLSLRWVGAAPIVPLVGGVDLVRGDDPIADAAPLRRVDGRAPPTLSGAVTELMPFLLLPDDLPADIGVEVRRALLGPATISEPSGELPASIGSPATAP